MKIIDPVPERLWSEVASQCEAATFFHTPAWADVISQSFPGVRIAAKGFQFGADDWVIFPCFQSGTELRGFFKHYVSNEPGVYGGFIFNKSLSSDRVRRMMPSLLHLRAASLRICGNPLTDHDAYVKPYRRQEDFTHILDLSRFKNTDEIYEQFARDIKKGVRDAEAQRVECALMEDPSQVKDYFAVYEKVTEHRGTRATNRYDLKLFENLFKRKKDGVKFWAARLHGKIIGGVVSCEFNRHIDLWHAAWLPMAHEMGAGKYVYYKVIEYAHQGGYKYFDFNPSGGHRGTAQLKERFGCSQKRFFNYSYEGGAFWSSYAQLRPQLKMFEDEANPDVFIRMHK